MDDGVNSRRRAQWLCSDIAYFGSQVQSISFQIVSVLREKEKGRRDSAGFPAAQKQLEERKMRKGIGRLLGAQFWECEAGDASLASGWKCQIVANTSLEVWGAVLARGRHLGVIDIQIAF